MPRPVLILSDRKSKLTSRAVSRTDSYEVRGETIPASL